MSNRGILSVLGFLALLPLAILPASASPTAFSVRSDADNYLYEIDLSTGVATQMGLVGFGAVEALSFQPGTGILFGYADTTDELITIDTSTGVATSVGPSGHPEIMDMGLTFDPDGNLWLGTSTLHTFFSVDPSTGAATAVGPQDRKLIALTYGHGQIYGLAGTHGGTLVTVDTATGATTDVAYINRSFGDPGASFAPDGTLWCLEEPGNIYTANIAAALAVSQFTKWLRGLPAEPDMTLNLLTAELACTA